MARLLQNKTNTEGPSADYPNGRIRDRVGVTPGTPANEEVYGDIHQFFERIANLSGVTFNDLPDNNTNGFQLVEALLNLAPELQFRGHTLYETPADVPLTLVSGSDSYAGFPRLKNSIDLNASSAQRIVSLGDSAPFGTEYTFVYSANTGNLDFIINSTNTGGKPQIKKFGVAANDTLFTPTANKVFKVVRMFDAWYLFET